MKNPFHWKKKEKKEKKDTEIKNSVLMYLPFILSFFAAYFLYQKTNSLLLTMLLPLSIFALTLLWNNLNHKESNPFQEVSSFYQHFLTYSSLEENYRTGFKMAIDALPLSDIKDKLIDYLETDFNEPIPLSIYKTRGEFSLLVYIQGLIKNEEEYSKENINLLAYKITAFQKEREKENNISPLLPIFILLSGFIMVFYFSLIHYA